MCGWMFRRKASFAALFGSVRDWDEVLVLVGHHQARASHGNARRGMGCGASHEGRLSQSFPPIRRASNHSKVVGPQVGVPHLAATGILVVEYEFSEEDWEDLTVYEAGASGPSACESVPTCVSSVAPCPLPRTGMARARAAEIARQLGALKSAMKSPSYELTSHAHRAIELSMTASGTDSRPVRLKLSVTKR